MFKRGAWVSNACVRLRDPTAPPPPKPRCDHPPLPLRYIPHIPPPLHTKHERSHTPLPLCYKRKSAGLYVSASKHPPLCFWFHVAHNKNAGHLRSEGDLADTPERRGKPDKAVCVTPADCLNHLREQMFLFKLSVFPVKHGE